MITDKKYTKEQFQKELKQLKESGQCPIKDPKFYEPWDMVEHKPTYKKDLSKG